MRLLDDDELELDGRLLDEEEDPRDEEDEGTERVELDPRGKDDRDEAPELGRELTPPEREGLAPRTLPRELELGLLLGREDPLETPPRWAMASGLQARRAASVRVTTVN